MQSLIKARFVCVAVHLTMCVCEMFTRGLTNSQLVRINRLMMNPELPLRNKHLLENVLYKNYESWALDMGNKFKKLHYYKCRHIPSEEVELYSRVGLLNAVRCYRPTKENAMFHLYAKHHISGKLYYGMTQLSPITNVSKKKLRNRGTHYERATHEPYVLERKIPNVHDIIRDSQILWSHIEYTCDPFTRRCIIYKFDHEFSVLRSNREVSHLMVCSEETVRTAILKYFIEQQLGIILVKSQRGESYVAG